jgi:hypothetical protein
MNQADAHFAGWLVCPVCRKETRHYTKDTHESPVMRSAEFGVRIAAWSRCSLNKLVENGSKLKKVGG